VRLIVLPLSALPLPFVDIVDVVFVEIVVVVDGHVSIAIPIAISPITTPSRTDRNAGAERQQAVTRRRSVRIRIGGRPIDRF
jgi:hypothetical protein